MKVISSQLITETVKEMCISANCRLNDDVRRALQKGSAEDKSDIARGVLQNLLNNADIADKKAEQADCKDNMVVFQFYIIAAEIFTAGGGEPDGCGQAGEHNGNT